MKRSGEGVALALSPDSSLVSGLGTAGCPLPQGFVLNLRSQNPRQRAKPHCFAGEDAGHGFFWLVGRRDIEVGEEVFRGGERT